MAQVIRRHWRLALLHLIVLIGGIGLLLHHVLKSAQQAEAVTVGSPPADTGANPAPATAAPLDAVAYTRVRTLLRRLALRNEDLAAMGCTQTQAGQVLSAVASWATTNSSNWTQQEQSRKTAEDALASAVRKINIGPRDETLLVSVPTLQQNAATARQQSDQFFQSAADSVSTLLSSTQQQTWTAARCNAAAGVPMRYRYAQGLTAEQAKPLVVATYRGQSGEAVLPGQASQQVRAAEQNLTQDITGVLAAEKAVLPVPAQLKAKLAPLTRKPGVGVPAVPEQ